MVDCLANDYMLNPDEIFNFFIYYVLYFKYDLFKVHQAYDRNYIQYSNYLYLALH